MKFLGGGLGSCMEFGIFSKVYVLTINILFKGIEPVVPRRPKYVHWHRTTVAIYFLIGASILGVGESRTPPDFGLGVVGVAGGRRGS